MDRKEVVPIASGVGVLGDLGLFEKLVNEHTYSTAEVHCMHFVKMCVHYLHKLLHHWFCSKTCFSGGILDGTLSTKSLFLKLILNEDVPQKINRLRSLYAKLIQTHAQPRLDSMRSSPMKSPVDSSLLSKVALSLGMATWARSLVIWEIS